MPIAAARRLLPVALVLVPLMSAALQAEDKVGIPRYQDIVVREMNATQLRWHWQVDLGSEDDLRPLLDAAPGLVATSLGKRVRTWTLDGKPSWQRDLPAVPDFLALSPGGGYLVVSFTGRNQVQIFSLAQPDSAPRVLSVHGAGPVAFDQEKRLFAATNQGLVIEADLEGRKRPRAIELADRAWRQEMREYGMEVRTLQVVGDGHGLFANMRDAGENGHVWYRDLVTGRTRELFAYSRSDGSRGFIFGEDGRYLVSTSYSPPGDGGFSIGRVRSITAEKIDSTDFLQASQIWPGGFDSCADHIAFTYHDMLDNSRQYLEIVDLMAHVSYRAPFTEIIYGLRFARKNHLITTRQTAKGYVLSSLGLP